MSHKKFSKPNKKSNSELFHEKSDPSRGEQFLFKRLSGGELVVLNAFPNTYEIGMASLGYQSIFRLYASNNKTHTFRYFTNYHEIHPKNFHLITFSISWELDFLNVLKILSDLSIPLKRSERGSEHPLVLAGGPVVSANPEPWAEIFDLIAIGDSENNTGNIIDTCLEYYSSNSVSKRDLSIFTEVPGLYIPELNNQCERQKSSNKQLLASSIIAPNSAWKDTALLEVVRSCPEMCRFCLASYLSLPFRSPDLESDLIPKAEELLRYTNNIGLLGASVSQHPEFIDLIKFFLNQTNPPKLQVASLRASTISLELATLLKKSGIENITIAIESGSERLRNIINKKLPEEYIFSAAQAISSAGIRSLKLYGMVGLPFERDEDIEDTINLLTQLKKSFPQLKIIWGCSVFTPKAQTPFQDYGVDLASAEKLKLLTNKLKPLGIEVRDESYNWAEVQALISRGDRSIGDLFYRVYQSKNSGAKIYKKLLDPTEYKHFVFNNWSQIIDNNSYDYPWKNLLSPNWREVLHKHKKEAEDLSL